LRSHIEGTIPVVGNGTPIRSPLCTKNLIVLAKVTVLQAGLVLDQVDPKNPWSDRKIFKQRATKVSLFKSLNGKGFS